MEYALRNRENGQYESIEFYDIDVIQTDGLCKLDLLAKLKNNEYSVYSSIKKGNVVTKIDMPQSVMMKIVSTKPFAYTIDGFEYTYYNKKKIDDFLYEIDYGNIDYDYAYSFFNSQPLLDGNGLCSSFRKGRYYGRNLDWTYDYNVSFVIHTPRSKDRLGVLGVSGNIPKMNVYNVNKNIVDYNGYDMFKLLPFFILDGINEKGVFINSNVAPYDNNNGKRLEYVIPATVEERFVLSSKMVPRFVLDNFSTANEAIDYLRKYTTIFFPKSLLEQNYVIHYFIGDKTNSYAIEFINGDMKITKCNYLTNFHIHDVTFNKGGKVFTPEDVEINPDNKPSIKNNIEMYGVGLERWNIIAENYRTITNKNIARQLLDSLFYSRTYHGTGSEPEKCWNSEVSHYHNNRWYDEKQPKSDDPKYFVNVDTPPSESTIIKNIIGDAYTRRIRGITDIWITCNSCLYDLQTKQLYVKSQEKETEYIFDI